MSADLIILLVGAGASLLTDLAHRQGWLKAKPVAPAPVSPTPTPANGQADQPALDFLQWLIAVKAGTIKLDDMDREVLKQIAAAMPEGGAPANPMIDDIVKRLLAAIAGNKAAPGVA